MIECPVCGGEGREETEEVQYSPQNYARFPEPEYVIVMVECWQCKGGGEIEDETTDL